jgi:5-methyltetrahydropteroyltriglutamate--homocysteine methyltransferase
MCYAELGDIVDALDQLDVDVLSFEAARSDMTVVDVLRHASYQGGAGPGIYDVHSPGVPETAWLEALIRRAVERLGPGRLWVNPDCGLKTRRYEQVLPALHHMVAAARRVRRDVDPGPGPGASGAGALTSEAPPG